MFAWLKDLMALPVPEENPVEITPGMYLQRAARRFVRDPLCNTLSSPVEIADLAEWAEADQTTEGLLNLECSAYEALCNHTLRLVCSGINDAFDELTVALSYSMNCNMVELNRQLERTAENRAQVSRPRDIDELTASDEME